MGARDVRARARAHPPPRAPRPAAAAAADPIGSLPSCVEQLQLGHGLDQGL